MSGSMLTTLSYTLTDELTALNGRMLAHLFIFLNILKFMSYKELQSVWWQMASVARWQLIESFPKPPLPTETTTVVVLEKGSCVSNQVLSFSTSGSSLLTLLSVQHAVQMKTIYFKKVFKRFNNIWKRRFCDDKCI